MHTAIWYGRLLMLAAAFAVFGGTLPARADGLEKVASFTSGTSQLVVDDFTQGAETVGLLGITPAVGKTISFAFKRDEWLAFIALWKKAAATSSGPWTIAAALTRVLGRLTP